MLIKYQHTGKIKTPVTEMRAICIKISDRAASVLDFALACRGRKAFPRVPRLLRLETKVVSLFAPMRPTIPQRSPSDAASKPRIHDRGTHNLRAGGPEDAAEADVRARARRTNAQIRREHAGSRSDVPAAPAKVRPARAIRARIVLSDTVRGAVPAVIPPGLLGVGGD